MIDSARTLTDTELVDEVVRLERQVGALHAQQAGVIAELSRRRVAAWEADIADAEETGVSADVRRGLEAAFDDGAAEIGLALALSPGTARARVEAAVAMCTTMPRTLAALKAGRLDRARAEHLARLTSVLSPVVREEVEAEVLRFLDDERVVMTRAKLGLRVREAIARADAASVAAAHAAKTAERRVWIEPLPDAMARLCVEGPAAQVHALYTAVDALARVEEATPDGSDVRANPENSNGLQGCPGLEGSPAFELSIDPFTQPIGERFRQREGAKSARDQAAFANPARPVDRRSIGARRFDALVAIAADVLADPDRRLGTVQGQAPHIQVTVAATTLAGADNKPGRLTGYGPIPADAARRLAAIGVWRRLLTDPVTGAVTEYGRRTYRPPAALRDLILARDTTCIQPSCGQPSRTSQIDHLTAYDSGGTTGDSNTGPQCGPHHLIKTHRPRWAVERLPDGALAWTSPTGHVYLRPPDPVGSVRPISRDDEAHEGGAYFDELTGLLVDEDGQPDTFLTNTEFASICREMDAAQEGTAVPVARVTVPSYDAPPPF